MPDLLEVEPILPPGLLLPSAFDVSERFQRDVFNIPGRPYDDVVELGGFMVALAMFNDERARNRSLMPTQIDVTELFAAGYGLGKAMINNNYGGLERLQRSLGFYPRNFRPEYDELVDRMKWVADYLGNTEDAPMFRRPISILEWGKSRDVLPSVKIVREVLDDDLDIVRDIFNLEKRKLIRDTVSRNELLRMGARIINEHGAPLTERQINRLYMSEVGIKPAGSIRHYFGNLCNFWREFGFITEAVRVDPESVLLDAVRIGIKTANPVFTKKRVEALSAQKKFHATFVVHDRFGGVANLNARVGTMYAEYLNLRNELREQGVSNRVCRVFSADFEPSDEFSSDLKRHAETLKLLSEADSYEAQYILRIIEHGFSVQSPEDSAMQYKDVKKALRKLGITDPAEKAFVLSHIPFCDLVK